MRITEFQKPITAEALNENVQRMFGQKINLDSFTLEQMYDARNKLRTRIHSFESDNGYSAVYEDESHTKNKMFLDVLNAAIAERESRPEDITFTEMEQMVLDKVDEGVIEFAQLPEELQEKVIAAAGSDQQLAEKAPEGWEGTVKAMKKHKDEIDNPYALAHYMKNKGYKSHKKESVEESIVTEGEEEKAEFIMSARDMVDRITGWMEDTANMQAENMLKLVDAIRDEMGSDVAMEFESIMKPALATVYTALESSRQQLTQGVGILTGQGDPEMMGSEPTDDFGDTDDFGAEDELAAEPDSEGEDEFATAASAAGGEEEAGRAKRESVEFSRRLATLLAPKKK
jgi:hypothetical protein